MENNVEQKRPYLSINVDSDNQELINAVSASILSGLKRDGFDNISVCVDETDPSQTKHRGTHRGLHKPESLLEAMKTQNPNIFKADLSLHVNDAREGYGVTEYRFAIEDGGPSRHYMGSTDLVEDE